MAVSGTKMKRLRTGDSSERVALFPEGQNQSQTKRCTKCRRVLKKHIFLILIILAMAAGIGLGTGLRMLETPLTGRQIYYVSFPGELFLQMLSMLLIPLIVSSLIVATTSLTPKSSGKMGIISLVYYIGSTTLAVATGITLVLLIRPGEADESGFGGLDLHTKAENQSTVSPDKTIDTLLDLVRNLFPGNIIEATFRRLHTVEVPKEAVNKTTFKPDMVPTAEKVEGSNILGIITFSLVLGIIISKLGNDGRPLVAFFEALNMAVMKMITLVIWYAPIGIMSLIASKIAAVEEPLTVLHQLSWFVITVVTGFGIHGLVTLPLLFLVLARRNPFAYLGNMLEAIITVFSTASSAATMPVTIRCLVENNDVDSRVVNFVIPVGTTVNMDGSAIYLAIAAIFLAQYNSMQLSAGQVITVGITSVAASVGAAPIPSGSLIAMVMVLTSVGIPTDIALIAAVDWLLDRFRGIVNVVGDSFAAGAVAQMARGGLHKERVIVEYSRFGQQETSLNLKDDYYELP